MYDEKHWQCACDHWKSIAMNQGQYHNVKNATNVCCVCQEHNISILYKQKWVSLTIVDGVLPLVCAVYLRYTF